METKSTPAELSALDWSGVAVAAFFTLAGLALVPVMTPDFARMFRDFGGALPWPTQAAVDVYKAFDAWHLRLFSGAPLAVVPTFLLGGGVVATERTLRQRRLLIAGSVVASLAAFALYVVLMYLPMFSITPPDLASAGAIK